MVNRVHPSRKGNEQNISETIKGSLKKNSKYQVKFYYTISLKEDTKETNSSSLLFLLG